jgi:hypothetical protein
MSNRVNVEIDSIHSRAICKEIGERLRISLSREPPELPPVPVVNQIRAY